MRFPFLIFLVCGVCGADQTTSTASWREFSKIARSATGSVIKRMLPQLITSIQSTTVTPACQLSMTRLAMAVTRLKKWATMMIDASGKPPSGILDGTAMDFGSFDGCLKIRVMETGGAEEAFRGRYCMVGYHSPLMAPLSKKTPEGMSYVDAYGAPPDWIGEIINKSGAYLSRSAFWYGACVPSACSEGDIKEIVTVLSQPLGFSIKVAGCYVDGPKVWTTSSFTAVCILCILLGLSAMGTLVDVAARYCSGSSSAEQSHFLLRILKTLSIYTNTAKLLDIPQTNDALGCFNGIRFFSAVWIILGHTYWFTDTWKYLKYRSALALDDRFNYYLPAAVLENFSIPVGSFFFMSGFLLVYTTWRTLLKTDGRLNLIMFVVHKYWRMTPALGLMILMLLALPAVGSGPLWKSTLDPPIESCEARWWTHLLYINNWWNSEQYCLIHTWYLPALMQFHIIGVILLLVIYRFPTVGVCTAFAVAVGSCVTTAVIAIWNDFPMPTPSVSKDIDLMDDYNSKIYTKPFCHVPSYFVGMGVAYFVARFKDVKLSLSYQVLGWILAVSCALSSVYGLYGPAESIGIRAFYISCYRVGWALSIGWLSFVCIMGKGGIANRILSWKSFVPLGQLSYLVYLLHPLIMLYRTASMRERIYYGHNELVFEFLTYTVLAFLLAFAGHVVVEKPLLLMEEIVLKKEKKESDPQPPVVTNGFKSIDP